MNDNWRGHNIHYNNRKWLYVDGQAVEDNPNRPCGYCNLSNMPEGYDGCIGKIPNVTNACCGHGYISDAYIQFPNGTVLRKHDVYIYLNKLERLNNE